MTTKASKVAIIPTTFGGRLDEDAFKYLQKFELVSISNHWTDDIKVIQLPNYLVGTAEKWFLNWKRERKASYVPPASAPTAPQPPITWAELTAALQLAFKNVGSKDIAEQKLLARKQKAGETAEDYLYSKLDLINDYDEFMPVASKIRYIVKGLRPSYLEKINFIGPTTIAEVLDGIRRISESSYLIEHREESNVTDTTLLANAISDFSKMFKSQNSEFTKLIKEQNDKVINLVESRAQKPQTHQAVSLPQTHQTVSLPTQLPSRSNTFCAYCKRSGHHITQCFIRPQNQINPTCTICGRSNHITSNCFFGPNYQPPSFYSNQPPNPQRPSRFQNPTPNMGNASWRERQPQRFTPPQSPQPLFPQQPQPLFPNPSHLPPTTQ
jgi:hypothetical protein